MQMFRRATAVVGLVSAVMMLSCESQDLNVYDMVSPQITEVSDDGRIAKVNIGSWDGVHAGQRLYVVRGNELGGMLTVLRPFQYQSECVVTASKGVSNLYGDAKVAMIKVKRGDLVVRKTKYITGAGLTRDRVPRMVPTPYTAYDADNETLTVGSQEIKIPRDQVEQWKKDHPLVKTGPALLNSGPTQ